MPTQLAPPAMPDADAELRSTPNISPRRSVIALTAVTALATCMAALAATPFGGLVIKPAVHLVSSTTATHAHARTATAGDSVKVATAKAPSSSSSSSSKASTNTSSASGTQPGWSTPDSPTLTAATAPFFIAGTVYGDPPGNHFGVTTMTSNAMVGVRRGGRSSGSLAQMEQAVKAVSGVEKVKASKAGGGHIRFELSSGQTITIDTVGWVQINGKDAFNLAQNSDASWTTTATGPQVRAFLAGYIEGEGNVNGKVGDDPSQSHLAFIQHLMSTAQGYNVPTTLTGKKYFQLFVTSTAYYPRIQAYPFLTYTRCPGGKPKS